MTSPTTFRRLAVFTIAAVYALIAVGSIVRVTGAGMGCPDWPTCFGKLIPPTSVNELPVDYKTRFAVQGKEIADFNVVHTWTEYTNRLIGVAIGLLILATFMASTRYWKTDKRITLNAFAALVLVLFEAWLGAKVVEHNLRPLTITLHYVLSLVIVFALSNAIVWSHHELWREEVLERSSGLKGWMIAGIAILSLQIVLGTQVREQVDVVSKAMNYLNRDNWLSSVGNTFYIHRSFSIAVLAVQLWMLRKLYYAGRLHAPIITWIMSLLGLLALEVLSGVIMTYLQMPWFIQPAHVMLSAIIIGIEYMLLLRIGIARQAT